MFKRRNYSNEIMNELERIYIPYLEQLSNVSTIWLYFQNSHMSLDASSWLKDFLFTSNFKYDTSYFKIELINKKMTIISELFFDIHVILIIKKNSSLSIFEISRTVFRIRCLFDKQLWYHILTNKKFINLINVFSTQFSDWNSNEIALITQF